MAESASQTITIAAAPDRVWAIATDFDRYPEWAKDVKDVIVRTRDEQGRPTEVEFRASALGRSTHYTLGYDYSQAPGVLIPALPPGGYCMWMMDLRRGSIERSRSRVFLERSTGSAGERPRLSSRTQPKPRASSNAAPVSAR